MNYIVLFLVFIVAFLGGVFIIGQVRKNKSVKPQPKAIPQTTTKQNTTKLEIKKPIVQMNRGQTATKPIICYECITDRLNQPTELVEGQELEPMGTVLVFDSWIPYAAHILKSHPNSTRVQWAIDCVKDEMNKLTSENKEYPEHLQTLIQLIKTHGQEPAEIDVGVQYNEFAQTNSQKVKATQKIQVIDDWAERLGEINKSEVSDNHKETKVESNKDWLEK